MSRKVDDQNFNPPELERVLVPVLFRKHWFLLKHRAQEEKIEVWDSLRDNFWNGESRAFINEHSVQ